MHFRKPIVLRYIALGMIVIMHMYIMNRQVLCLGDQRDSRNIIEDIESEMENGAHMDFYIIDLHKKEYKGIKLGGGTRSENKQYVEIGFWHSEEGEKIATIMMDPDGDEVIIQFLKRLSSNFNMMGVIEGRREFVLYNPSTQLICCIVDDGTKFWDKYKIEVFNQNRMIKIKKVDKD